MERSGMHVFITNRLPPHGLFALRATGFEEKNHHEVENWQGRRSKDKEKKVPGTFLRFME
jgi:hypothetical protein